MSEHTLTLRVPSSLWAALEKLAKARGCTTNQVALDALEFHLPGFISKPELPLEEEKAAAIKRLYKNQARHKFLCEKMAADGKIHPMPKDIPLEQVRRSLASIKGSLTEEVIKEREEGW